MAVLIFNDRGYQVRRSKDMRGVSEHARKTSPVKVVRIGSRDEKTGRYPVNFHFDNGDECRIGFDDWKVALLFVAERRSWAVERVRLAPSLYVTLGAGTVADKAADKLRKRGTVVHDLP